MNREQLVRFYRKRYGKPPAFTELEQFLKRGGAKPEYITEDDREAIRERQAESGPEIPWDNRVLSGKARKNKQHRESPHALDATTEDML